LKRCPRCSETFPDDFGFCPRDGVSLRISEDPLLDPLVGRLLGGSYRLVSRIGGGGMGIVYRAEHLRTGRTIAIKVLLDSVANKGEAAARFEREARAAARLSHPGIVGMLDFGISEDGMPYIVMEFAEGRTLQERLREQGVLKPGQAVEIGIRLAEALAVAHRGGVVHRDLKPANILILEAPDGSETIKILDFGVSRVTEESTSSTHEGTLVGTPFYMPPEQARGEQDIDSRADVYSLGVVLYEILTGTVPFHGETPLAVLARILAEQAPPIRERRPEVPERLAAVIEKAMARDPEGRFQVVSAMQKALADCLEEANAAPEGMAQPRRRTTTVGESRVVTVLLAELDTIAETGRDEAAELLASGFEAFEEMARAEGAAVERLLGHRVFAVFGLSGSFGDEPARAVRTALSSRDALQPFSFTFRAAVGTGRVVTGGTVGTGVTGEAVSAASRLLRAAPGEGVFVDRSTLRSIRGAFETRALEGGVHEVLAERRGHRTEAPGGIRTEAPLVGRDNARRMLTDLLRYTLDARKPSVVLVVGGPGVGKTRLRHVFVQEIEALPIKVRILEGQANPLSTESPHALLADAIRRQAEISRGEDETTAAARLLALVADAGLDSEAEEVAHVLGAALGVPFPESRYLAQLRSNPEVLRNRIRWAFGRLFRGWLEEHPTVFLGEDLHWVDAASLDALVELQSTLTGPFLFVGVARPEFDERFPDFRALRVALPPLSSEEVATFVEESLEGKPPAPLLEVLRSRAEGNPFFLEEILHDLRDREVLVRVDGEWTLRGSVAADALPVGIEAALQARIDRLPADERETLKRAAVVGRDFWEEALAALGVEHPEDALGRLARRDLVVRGHRSRVAGAKQYAFRHGLMREVAYGMIPRRERSTAHARVATWLAERGIDEPAVLARHHELAGNPAEAAAAYARAARASLDEFANTEAASHGRRAAALAPDDAERLRCLVLVEEALTRLERGAERYEVLQEIGSLSDRVQDPASRALALLLRGRERLDALEPMQALEALSEAVLGYERARDRAGECNAACLYARSLALVGRARQALEAVERALALARDSGDSVLVARSLRHLVFVVHQLGDLPVELHVARQALDAARAAAQVDLQAIALNNLGNTLMQLGRLEEATKAYAEATRLAAQVGLLGIACIAEIGQAEVHLLRLDLPKSREAVLRALQIANRQQDTRKVALGEIFAATIDAQMAAGSRWEEGGDRADAIELAWGDSPVAEIRMGAWAAAVACRTAARDGDGVRRAEEHLVAALGAEGASALDRAHAWTAIARARIGAGDARGGKEAAVIASEAIKELAVRLPAEDGERIQTVPFFAEALREARG